MIEIANSELIKKKNFYMIKKRINIDLFAVETLGRSFRGLDKRDDNNNNNIP